MGPFPREDMMAGLDAMAGAAPPADPMAAGAPASVLCSVCNTVIDSATGEPIVTPEANPMAPTAPGAAAPPMM